MELTEPIESINKQLIDLFGVDTVTGRPIFRVVWAADQLEKRLTNITPEGFQLIHPQVMELPKYNQRDLDYKDRYILERLVLVGAANAEMLPTVVQSYEPLWVFRDENNNYLPPKIQAAKFIIDTLYANMGKKSMAKYVDEEAKNPIEVQKRNVDRMQADLFGNETTIGDALAYKEGVGYTGPSKN